MRVGASILYTITEAGLIGLAIKLTMIGYPLLDCS